jgi:DNA-binding NtrC family response regulator
VEQLSLMSPHPVGAGVWADNDELPRGTSPVAESGTAATAAALPPQGVDLAQWEKSVIEHALREARGNQTRAAQRLGITRDTLRYGLKKFGLQP